MHAVIKRALAPSFFCIALGCFLAASLGYLYRCWWMGLCIPAAFFLVPRDRQQGYSAVGVAMICYGLFLFANAVFINPVDHPEGYYFAATFLIVFLASSRLHVWLVQHGFRLFGTVAGLLAFWAVLQWATGWGFLEGATGTRGQALFSTPNTLATAINLALAPLLVFYLLGGGNRRSYGGILLLFAGLLASQSRGGYLGLLAAMLFFVGYIGLAAARVQAPRYLRVLLGFAGVMACFKLAAWLGVSSWSLDNVAATLEHGDSSYRWQIYGVAWHLLLQHFWQGIGYFNFGYYFEMYKVPPFLDGRTFFVHDDYLQLALETGVAGIGLFLLLIASLYCQVFRYRAEVLRAQRLPVLMSVAALTSMLAHALVDFPFYIPVLIACFAAYAATIDRQLVEMGARTFGPFSLPRIAIPGMRPQFIRGLALITVLVWLGLPALAEAAASFGLHRLEHGDARWGLYFHRVARILQPRDAGYYWREGIVLRDLGVVQHNGGLLEKSDHVFAQGVEVNRFEVNNLLARAALQRQHRALLTHPVSREDILAWVVQAKALQPYSDGVQVEYVQCLAFAGRREEAIGQAKLFMQKRPGSKAAAALLNTVSRQG